jgi:hypothetical protein
MGIFDKIKNAIWGEDEGDVSNSPTVSPQKPPVVASSASTGLTPKAAPAPTAPSPGSSTTAPTKPGSAGGSAKPVDVAAMLDGAVKKKGQKLDWRHSIVDLMKALDMDSSLSNRKELAEELNYDGDTSNSAAMNMWLHKALMKKLSEHGGRVPPELLD